MIWNEHYNPMNKLKAAKVRAIKLAAGARPPFVYVLKQRLKIQHVGGKLSRFKIAAHKIIMRDEDYALVKNRLEYIEEANRNLKIPLKYEIWKESLAFGDGDYE